jgi:hypothetical protein
VHTFPVSPSWAIHVARRLVADNIAAELAIDEVSSISGLGFVDLTPEPPKKRFRILTDTLSLNIDSAHTLTSATYCPLEVLAMKVQSAGFRFGGSIDLEKSFYQDRRWSCITGPATIGKESRSRVLSQPDRGHPSNETSTRPKGARLKNEDKCGSSVQWMFLNIGLILMRCVIR